jgi:NAD(P)-dependent dehydrogenase (short-subunit alcohol dehydrogenase family)
MKCAVITGASGYLGKMLVAELARRDWECVPYPIKKVHAFILAGAPPIDRMSLLALTQNQFDKTIRAALNDGFRWAKTVIPHMPPCNSVFLGITSQVIQPGESLARMGAYGVAKIALRGLLRALEPELTKMQIRVNSMAPDFLPGGLNRDLPESMRTYLASKSRATPEQIVEIIARICDDPTAYPSGMSINALGEAEPL